MSRITRRVRVWLALVAAVILGVAPAHGLVFCLGTDGSIELEVEVSGRCGDCCAQDPASQPGPVIQHKCGCVDVEVTLVGSRLGAESVALPEIDPRANALPLIARHEPLRVDRALIISDIARPPPLSAQARSIVILI